MSAGEGKGDDFYAVLGLKKECSASELRNAYKKLALKWHPDRCSASGNSKSVEEAKKKFQAIQEAYSVLSDTNKRFLYDVGVYDCNDDENGNGEESFEELQELFEEMFQSDIEAFGSKSQNGHPPSCSSSLYASCSETSIATNKRNASEMNSGNAKIENSSGFESHFEGFCFGANHQENTGRGKGTGGGFKEEPEIGSRVGNKRFLRPTMSPLMTILVFSIDCMIAIVSLLTDENWPRMIPRPYILVSFSIYIDEDVQTGKRANR
ncbi:uncharacterized protein LOC130750637 isoform X2 [Actinidia eriantha]|uniref:uncharacterized protein LOC130750637 isoform X2 n=1 Tax=Actinidia eriantha TaxID=165200 RepID=UPI0025857E11|nr:uncharacterized protein LOC130750637 isoform X2 [Actinidia eriantha]